MDQHRALYQMIPPQPSRSYYWHTYDGHGLYGCPDVQDVQDVQDVHQSSTSICWERLCIKYDKSTCPYGCTALGMGVRYHQHTISLVSPRLSIVQLLPTTPPYWHAPPCHISRRSCSRGLLQTPQHHSLPCCSRTWTTASPA
jgi:hypothetical protein